MRAIIRFFAVRTHNVKAQLLLSTFYGLLSIYGFGGTVAIMLKVRKMENAARKANR
jgi:hypothetical protein